MPAPVPTYRAEVALHAALPNIVRQGDVAMLSTLIRRVGDKTAPMAASGTDDASASGWGGANRRAWGRVLSGSVDVQQDGTAGIDSHTRQNGLQTGVDLFSDARWNAGLFVGALHAQSRVNGTVGGVADQTAGTLGIHSNYLGAYGTYAGTDGQYADMVLQYGRHDVAATAPRSTSNAHGSSLSASLEAGQSVALGRGWTVEPQAQLIYHRLTMDSVGIAGATIEQNAASQVIGRLGVRVTGDLATGAGRLQPYGRVSLWHGLSDSDSTRFVSAAATTSINSGIGYSSTELALGFTLHLSPAVSAYGEVGKQFKNGGATAQVKSSMQGSVGLKLNF